MLMHRKNIPEFGFKSMADMMRWGEEVGAFYSAGHQRTFLHFYLSDYCPDHIYDFYTKDEVKALREYQKALRAAEDAADAARGWELVARHGYADNSVEAVYRDKYGNERTVMEVAPHGDAC